MMKEKVIGTMGTTQTRNQVCCSRRNYMMRKIDVRLAHRQKFCSVKKDRVAQLKSLHDNDIADKARNDLKDY